jgi:hypothetical protein
MQKRVGAVLAAVAVAGLGAALGVALAGSSSTKTTTRLVTVASKVTVPARTVTQVRTIERVRTEVRTVGAPGASAPGARVPTGGQGVFSPGPHRPQQFSGTGSRVLGTIVIGPPGATLRWTNSGGYFRLLFNGNGVAADSTDHAGQISAPPLTYQQVKVETAGRWTIRIG